MPRNPKRFEQANFHHFHTANHDGCVPSSSSLFTDGTALITAASGLNELLVTRTEGHEKEHSPIDIKKELWVTQPAVSHSGLPKMMSRLNGEKQAPT